MTAILVLAGIAVAIWLVVRLTRPTGKALPARLETMPVSPPPARGTEIELRWPVLPDGVEQQIEAAFSAGEDPSEAWLEAAPGWGCRFHSVAGESFHNDNGTSRQEYLRAARAGTKAYLVPEPSNEFDRDAVAVYLDAGGGRTAQIGYLPRDHFLGADIAAGKVASWLARIGQPGSGRSYGAVLYLAIKET